MKNFSELPPHSRIWIYQCGRKLVAGEKEKVRHAAQSFLEEWTTHGKKMDAAVEILHDHFIVIAVDESTAPASGCGIDKSVHFIKFLEQDLKISLLDRTKVAYRDNGTILTCSLNEVGKLGPHTLIFNNLISTKAEMETAWEQKAGESWVGRLF